MKPRTIVSGIMMAALAALAQVKPSAPALEPGTVTMPLDEYNKLLDLANKPVKTPEAPLLAHAIHKADMKLEASADAVRGAVQFDGEVFATGLTKVPLISELTVLDAQQKQRPVPLQLDGTMHMAPITGPGVFSITLQVAAPLKIEPGRASFHIHTPASGGVRLALTVPGDHTTVAIRPGLITAQSSSGRRTTVEAALPAGASVFISWATREAPVQAAPKETKFLSSVQTMVSVRDGEMGLTALGSITVLQGEPKEFEMTIPAGYEVTEAAGVTLESSEWTDGAVSLKVNDPKKRNHEFLISLEKATTAVKEELALPVFRGTQRETGEALVEGEGTIELAASETGGLKRMDLREAAGPLRSLARSPLQAAFRYHKQPGETPGLALEWKRYPDSGLVEAVVQRATITTMATSEGKSITEVRLSVRNQAQPFLRVALPAGAALVSAEVAGEKVKPLQGADGSRVPLLRSGFRPSGPYPVSFVFMHSGAPFAKKGGSEITLPRMDAPIGLLDWEVFLPDRYKVKDFGGDAIPLGLLPHVEEDLRDWAELRPPAPRANVPSPAPPPVFSLGRLGPGQIGGVITDPTGAVVSGAQIEVVHEASGVSRRAVTNEAGQWMATLVPSGPVRIKATAPGFKPTVITAHHDTNRPTYYTTKLDIGDVAETITVSASVAGVAPPPPASDREQRMQAATRAASSNVFNLQQRVAGVLPIAVSVPRTGTSYRFVRPLVLDEETRVTFSYRTR